MGAVEGQHLDMAFFVTFVRASGLDFLFSSPCLDSTFSHCFSHIFCSQLWKLFTEIKVSFM